MADVGVFRSGELYVDGGNEPALATYRRLGFTNAAIDVARPPAQRS